MITPTAVLNVAAKVDFSCPAKFLLHPVSGPGNVAHSTVVADPAVYSWKSHAEAAQSLIMKGTAALPCIKEYR